MAKYKAYPEYKDSGVEWLGLVPESWTVCRLKNLATIKNGQDYKFVQTDDGYPVMGSGGQFTFASKFMYDKPSVLLGRKGTIDKPLYINEPFWTVDTMYYTELNEGFDAKYLHYLALTIQFSRYSTNTALPSMTQEHLSNYKFSVPKAESERKKITEFLDIETAKIDNLLEKQQQLIELLKEKCQAVISQAVTKGLNPDVPMKDSGVEWLGEVPAHWTVSTIKHISTFIGTGGTPKNSESFTDDDGVDWFSPGDFNGSLALRHAKKKITTQAVSNGDAKSYPKDSIVVIGIGATLGKVAFVDHEFSCNQQINIITPSKTVDHKYLTYSLMNQVEQMKQSSNASTIGIMNQEKTKQIWIAFPPKDEQIKVVSFLSQKKIEFDELLKKSKYQILLLQERRTALISAAVTGKIDVRDWVAPDTQDIDEPQEATA
ncbi:restriction endonuclease subunit S [Klebsiella quasipneumoniae]|nr:restriction endonuclease subunit S [Klebsiella quasipneumoniae]